MNRGINLLSGESRAPINKDLRRVRILRVLAVSFLFGIAGISIILFFLISLSPLPSLQDQEKQALTRIQQYHQEMAQFTLISDRLKASKTVLAQRTDYSTLLMSIRETIPSDLTVTAFQVDEKEISLTVSGKSLASIETFLENLVVKSEEQEDFSKVIMEKLFFNQSGSNYTMTVLIQPV